jgi:hypothetical protein
LTSCCGPGRVRLVRCGRRREIPPLFVGEVAEKFDLKPDAEAAAGTEGEAGVIIAGIDLYQAHRHDWSTDLDETWGVLTDLVRQGKVRYLGSSSIPSARTGSRGSRSWPRWPARPG